MQGRTATILGFLVASLIPALQHVVLAVMAEAGRPSAPSEKLLYAAVTFLVYYPFSMFFTAVFGVPTYFLAKRLRLVTWWFGVVTGVSIGVLLSVIAGSPNRPYIGDVLMFVPAAVAAAVVFWLIWRKGDRPNMHTPPTS